MRWTIAALLRPLGIRNGRLNEKAQRKGEIQPGTFELGCLTMGLGYAASRATLDADKPIRDMSLTPWDEDAAFVDPRIQKAAWDAIRSARLFEVADSVIADLLLQTDNELHPNRLPHPALCLELPFSDSDYHYLGVLLWEEWNEAHRLIDRLDKEFMIRPRTDGRPEYPDIMFAMFGMPEKSQGDVQCTWGAIYDLDPDDWPTPMIMNFLDFVNTPDVQFIEGRRSETNRKNFGQKYGVDPPAFWSRLVLTGELQKYIDSVKSDASSRGLGHTFEVRGHWRVLQHPRYGENIGRRIWIPPHTKGRGIFIPRFYQLEAPTKEGASPPRDTWASDQALR